MTDESPGLCFLSATELARRIRERETSALEVMAAHLARIERLNPRLNAIVTLDAERALEGAPAAPARPWPTASRWARLGACRTRGHVSDARDAHDLRSDAQPVRSLEDLRRKQRRRWPAAWLSSPTAATSAARCAIPPGSATSSACARRSDACRSGRRKPLGAGRDRGARGPARRLRGARLRARRGLARLDGADGVFETLRGVLFAITLGDPVDEHPEMFRDTIVWNVAQGRSRSGPAVAIPGVDALVHADRGDRASRDLRPVRLHRGRLARAGQRRPAL
jgi:hypothetical protein